MTGQEFVATIEAVTKSKFTLRPMSWWMIKTVGQLLAMGRELSELEYLWRVPHRIAGDKLKAAIGGFRTRRCPRRSRRRSALSATRRELARRACIHKFAMSAVPPEKRTWKQTCRDVC